MKPAVPTRCGLLLLVLGCLLFQSLPTFAYRGPPQYYRQCQTLLSALNSHLYDLSQSDQGKIPKALRFDPKTGLLDAASLVELALISNLKDIPGREKPCSYALSPWVWAVAEPTLDSDAAIYCVHHGFNQNCYDECPALRNTNIETGEQVASYFRWKCQQVGLDPASYTEVTTGFDPDKKNRSDLSDAARFLLAMADKGGLPLFILLHLFSASLVCAFVFWKGAGRTDRLARGLTAGGAFWLASQAGYLLAYGTPWIDPWGSQYLRVPGPVMVAHLVGLLLPGLLFLVTTVLFWRENGPIIYPIVLLVGCGVGILGINALTSLVGLLCFLLLLGSPQSARSRG